jgi:hypothetical protein
MFSHQEITLTHFKFEMITPFKQRKGQLYNSVTVHFKHLYVASMYYLLPNFSLTYRCRHRKIK